MDFAYVFPHYVQNSGADKGVFDGAWEKEATCVLDQ